MAKFQSPLLGYNNNVRHKGRVFHIQTEDSGVHHPHIITHLFMDGGRILKSVKKSYAEHVGHDNMSETVRVLMKEQHKAMFIALREGQFDALLDDPKKISTPSIAAPTLPKPDARPAEPKPPVVDARRAEPKPAEAKLAPSIPKPPPSKRESATAALAATSPPAMLAAPSTKAEPEPEVEAAPNTVSDDRRPVAPSSESDFVFPDDSDEVLVVEIDIEDSRPNLAAAVEVAREPNTEPSVPFADVLPDPAPTVKDLDSRASLASHDESNPNTKREPERRASAAELTLDFDALEREPSPSGGGPYYVGELPPPPRNLFAKEPRTSPYSATLAAQDERTVARTSGSSPRFDSARSGERLDRVERADRPEREPAPPTPRSPSTKSAEGRYAGARPAAIFGASGPKEQASPSIFSDELVSDKSLDEVILSYLAEDLEPPRRK